MKKLTTTAALITAATVIAFGAGMGGADAARLLTGHDIKDGTVQGVDIENGTIQGRDLSDNLNARINKPGPQGAIGPKGLVGDQGPKGEKGDTGPQGADGLTGAFYATATYNAGDTNAGAIATVACSATSTDYTALAGGVQMIGVGGANSAVGSSFPGRMDWSTNTPKADRLDGWIIQFDADHAPEKVTVWALCVPGTDFNTVNTYTQQ